MSLVESALAESFEAFVTSSGARLQQALVALLGQDVGQDATSDALSYAWQHWNRISVMKNPAGYLFVVGRSRGRRMLRRPVFPAVRHRADDEPWIEPGLPVALSELSERQRVATVLVHGGGWTYAEVAELLQVDRGTAKKHADRGLKKLRVAMEVTSDA